MPTHNDAIKVTPIESHLLQPPRHPHFLQKDYEKHKMMVLFLTLLHHLVPSKKVTPCKTLQRYQGWSALGGGLGCVCILWFCYVDILICGPISRALSLQLKTSTYWLYTCSVFVSASSLLCIS